MRYLILSLALVSTFVLAADPAAGEPDVSFFTKLRMDYSKRKDFSPMWKINGEREAVVAAYKEKDYKRAFELAGQWLAKCPVDADIHTLRSASATPLGDIKSYIYHMHFAYGLMQSVTASGDGRTPKTAFKVISVAEEYSVLREFGAQVTKQALVDGPCDKMDCKFPDGTEVTLYFDVSIPMRALPQ
jgi:hypothetical protein